MTDPFDDVAAASGFSGVVRVERADGTVRERAYGLADRAHGVPMTTDTRIGVASGSKVLTALVVVALAEAGALPLDTPARQLLGDDLPLVADGVTVEHLLAHRSGIGDYFDEDVHEDPTDHVLTLPVHRLVRTEDFLPLLDGHPQAFPPGERFGYCNGGFVVLALLAERATGRPYHDLVDELVCRPAGLAATGFPRLDELPGDVALGYLHRDGLRSNVLHLPVRATGDGGATTTAADVHALWRAFLAGEIVPPGRVAEMTRRRSDTGEGGFGYGLGLWLRPGGALQLEGMDAGASFRSVHDPATGTTWSVLSNWTDGAWPVAHHLADTVT